MRWIKTGKKVSTEGTTITYSLEGDTGYTIESRRRMIPHSGRPGFWEHTTYFVLKDGKELKELYSLGDAKGFVLNDSMIRR